MPLFKKRLSEVFKRPTFRNPTKDKAAKWARHVLETLDEFAISLTEITNRQNQSNHCKSDLVSVNKLLLERIAAYSKHHFKLANLQSTKIELGVNLDDEEGNNSFNESVTKVTQDLFHIQVCLENETGELNRSAINCFNQRLKELPTKKQEIENNLAFGLKCVHEEMQRQEQYEKLYKSKKPSKQFPFIRKKSRGIETERDWNKAMTLAQVHEAVRLTNEAFVKFNSIVSKSQKDLRTDLVRYLKQFIIIELQYHCKALEHLTKAYNAAKECQRLLLTSPEAAKTSNFNASNKGADQHNPKKSLEDNPSATFESDLAQQSENEFKDVYDQESKLSKRKSDLAGIQLEFANFELSQPQDETTQARKEIALRELYQAGLSISPDLAAKILQDNAASAMSAVDTLAKKSLQHLLTYKLTPIDTASDETEASQNPAVRTSTSQTYDIAIDNADFSQNATSVNTKLITDIAASQNEEELHQKSREFVRNSRRFFVEKQLLGLSTSSNATRSAAAERLSSHIDAKDQLSLINKFNLSALASTKTLSSSLTSKASNDENS